ncbi:MAG TPA: hypothetical protein VH418_20110 [Solirubrobacteraceae bacterium]|jgi:hypothetical protein
MRATNSQTETPRRASVPEIVGAWLHIWTPPRDVDVPPVPWRKLAIATAIGAVVCAGAAAAIVPAIDRGKERRSAQERAHDAAVAAAERRRIVHEQLPRHASAPALRPSRTALLARLERDISRDAAARVRAGELKGPIGATTCGPAADARPAPGQGVFDCFTVVDRIAPSAANGTGAIGYPFRAVVDWRRFAYSWCKTNPVPGERVVPDPRTVVVLPPACRGR